MDNNPADGAVIAPVQNVAPRKLRVERGGARSEPYTQYFPQVRAGICEFCGVLDPNLPSEVQYKLCPHFRGLELRCSYCDENKNPEEIVGHSILNIHSHPDNPDSLVVVCDSYRCSEKHLARFSLNR